MQSVQDTLNKILARTTAIELNLHKNPSSAVGALFHSGKEHCDMLNYISFESQYNFTYRLLLGFDMLYYIKHGKGYKNAYQNFASGRPPCRDAPSPEGSAREAWLESEGVRKPSRPAADAHFRHRVGEDRAPLRHAS